MAAISSLCVYCASSPGSNQAITDATIELGTELAARGIRLVYGGGAVGLMGLIADTVLDNGGAVTGIIPTSLFPKEVGHRRVTELIEVDSMHTRKRMMFERSDAFIALPGGFGTLEEVTEMTTWAQIGIHSKPIGLLNVDGYWDPLLAWLDRCEADELMKPSNRALLVTATTASAMFDAFDRYDPPRATKWLELDET